VNKPDWKTWSQRGLRILWALLLFTLPVTSFPYLPAELGGRTLVRPLAIYPLALLMLLVILPRLFTRPLPRTFLPLMAFVVVAMISSLIAFSSDLEVYRGVSLASRFLRNLVTLGLGVSFYVTVSLLPRTWQDMRFSLRWLYVGFGLALLWGTLQIPYVIHYWGRYFKLMQAIQGLVSSRKLFPTRISGMTYEPKWFAEQICFLLIPWLLGAVLTRQSVFKWRWRWITVELVMLAWAIVVLVFTFSRTGLFILAVMAFLGYWLFRSYTLRTTGAATPPIESARRKKHHLLEAGLVVAVLLGGLVIVGSQNPYFSRLWRYWTDGKARSRTYLEFIAFEQRFVYWATALRIYQQQPLLGVGLGNYAFYFADMVPDQSYEQQQEMMRQLTPGEGRDRLITPKNLYARLISETGLLGVATFTTFLLGITGCILYLWFSTSPAQRYWGMSGFLALVVFAFVIFSFDSFALPNMWVVFGLLTAAAHLDDPADKAEFSLGF
jgi:O-antigen ligase